jgi:Flp pilus assembly protein TadG
MQELGMSRHRIISRRAIAGAGRQDGQVLVFSAVLLTLLLGLVALTVDLGSMYVAQRHAQTAADAGSLAAAEDLPLPANTTAAATDAANYGHTLNDSSASITSNAAPVGGSGCTSPSYNSTAPTAWAACFEAQVGVTQTLPLTFARLFGVNTGTVSASAVSTVNLIPPPSASGGGLVSNGNFPTGCNPPTGYTQTDPTFCEPGIPGSASAVNAGSTIGTSGTPWNVIFGNVDWAHDGSKYVNYVEPPGYSGANVIDMNGDQDGGIAQTINGLTAGKKYVLSFLLSGNAGYSEPTFTMTVAIGGALSVAAANPPATPTVTCPSATFCIPVTQVDNPASVMGWEWVGIPFAASSTSTTISFVSTSSQANVGYDNTGPTIAQVSVLPATYSLAQ